jgi:superfamily II DNA/RNA helicase
MSEKPISFESYSFPVCINQALDKMGFTSPTPIQQKLIPLAMEGKDILGSAQTGSGKTASYLLPFLSQLINQPDANLLVLVPTRELAGQVSDVCTALLERAPQIRIAKVVGGARMGQQIQKLSRNPRVIVATPGRLNDHLNRFGKLLQKTSFLVVDEADRMLDMGFAPQLERVLRFLPAKRQSLLLSATMPAKILQLSSHFLNKPMPDELDKMKRRMMKLEIEQQALKKEKDSDRRLKAIAVELANLKEKTKELRVKLSAEKELINKIKGIREKLDALYYQTEIAQREADLEKVAEIKYGKIPTLLKEQKSIEQKLVKLQKSHHFLKEEVNEEDVARVVSR